MKKILLVVAMILCMQTIMSQSQAEKRIAEMAKNDNQVMEHLDILANRFGGRMVGSNAYDNARDWAASLLKSWGYQVEFEEVGQMGVGFNRDHWWGKMYAENGEVLDFVTPSFTVGTVGQQRGHVVIEPRTTREFNKMKGTIKGAWVLVDGDSRGWALQHHDSVAAKRKAIIAHNDSTMKRGDMSNLPDSLKPDMTTPALFYDEMIAAGALGFIQAAPQPLVALYDRDVVKGKLDFYNLPAVPDIKLDKAQYERLRKMVSERRHVDLEFDIRNHFRMGPVPFHSIIATMKGKKYPDELVIMGAHLDAYDSGTGSTDDGNGVSTLLEAARMIAKSGAKPDRTIMFIIFAGEEFGLWGSDGWTKAHPDKLDKISNMFNRDGGPLPYTAFSAPKSMVKEFEPVAKMMNELYPDIPFTLDAATPRPKLKQPGGNDATTFMVLGIPAIQMNEWTDPLGYNFDYREIWHTDRDTYNRVIPYYQQQAATALALMILRTANASKMFPRDEVYSD
ncbi:MAG: M20/M25/M40 family metallo-hydrolase [Duncaniella sp.]|nr:M20/M25/M40 family metallo-hydrolase [Duncaniella sp.]